MSVLKKFGMVCLSFGILIGTWQLLIFLGGYSEALFPSPLKVGEAIVSMIQDYSIFVHIQVSLTRFFIGYFLAVVLAVMIGLLVGRIFWLWEILNPIVQMLRPVTPLAWSPFIVLWFGIGDMPAIVIIFIAAFFPILLSTVSAVRKIQPIYLKVAQNLELTRWAMIWKIYLPSAFPMIISGMRIALGAAWIFLVAGEMVGAQSGLGYLIVDARNSMNLDDVMAGIVFIGGLGFLLDKCIVSFETRINKRWGQTPA